MSPCHFVLHFCIRILHAKGLGEVPPKSGIVFKNLFVRIHMAECTEIIIGAFETCFEEPIVTPELNVAVSTTINPRR